jgi:hypothetical protein
MGRAFVGSSGGSTGAHWHGGVKDAATGEYINPTQILRGYVRINGKPLDPSLVTSGYGPRVHPIHGGVRPHRGEDYGYEEGAEVTIPGARFLGGSYDKGGGGNIATWEVTHKDGKKYQIVGMHHRDPVTGKVEPSGAPGAGPTGAGGKAPTPGAPAAGDQGPGVDPAEIAALQSVFDATTASLKNTISQSAALQKSWAASSNPLAAMQQIGVMPVAAIPTIRPSPFQSVFRGMDRGVLGGPAQGSMPRQAPGGENPYVLARQDTINQLMAIYGVGS